MLSFRYMITDGRFRPTLSVDYRSSFTLSSVIPKPFQFQLESDQLLIYFHGRYLIISHYYK